MTTAETPLVLATRALERTGEPWAIIGATAMAAWGVSRSTHDIDLLTTSRSVLNPAWWSSDEHVSVRTGDEEDPLAGVVRLSHPNHDPVDVVVGKLAWQRAICTRAIPVSVFGTVMPVARAADLILLKLYAGGAQDRWDIEQLLGADNETQLSAEVDEAIEPLPPSCHRMWRELRAHRR